ncbi:unnamed protein product, partial [Discosporangium mesarthrocarpum]
AGVRAGTGASKEGAQLVRGAPGPHAPDGVDTQGTGRVGVEEGDYAHQGAGGEAQGMIAELGLKSQVLLPQGRAGSPREALVDGRPGAAVGEVEGAGATAGTVQSEVPAGIDKGSPEQLRAWLLSELAEKEALLQEAGVSERKAEETQLNLSESVEEVSRLREELLQLREELSRLQGELSRLHESGMALEQSAEEQRIQLEQSTLEHHALRAVGAEKTAMTYLQGKEKHFIAQVLSTWRRVVAHARLEEAKAAKGKLQLELTKHQGVIRLMSSRSTLAGLGTVWRVLESQERRNMRNAFVWWARQGRNLTACRGALIRVLRRRRTRQLAAGFEGLRREGQRGRHQERDVAMFQARARSGAARKAWSGLVLGALYPRRQRRACARLLRRWVLSNTREALRWWRTHAAARQMACNSLGLVLVAWERRDREASRRSQLSALLRWSRLVCTETRSLMALRILISGAQGRLDQQSLLSALSRWRRASQQGREREVAYMVEDLRVRVEEAKGLARGWELEAGG